MKYKTKKIFMLFSIFALLQFLILSAIAMLLYPGGTKFDHDSIGYSFLNNFFSDLGRTITFKGTEKKASFYLFSSSLFIAGLSTISYFILFPAFFNVKELSRKISYGSAAAGIISGIAYIGVAFTPWNLLFHPHVFFVKAAFTSFLILTVFSIAAIYTDPVYPKIYGAVFIIFGIILSGYLYVLFFGPKLDSAEAILLHVISQKIVIYSEIVCMLIQSYGAYKLKFYS